MSSRGGNSRRADKGKAVALDQSDEFVPVSPFFDGGGDGDFSVGRQWSRDEILQHFEGDDDVQVQPEAEGEDDVPGEDDDTTAPPPTTQGSRSSTRGRGKTIPAPRKLNSDIFVKHFRKVLQKGQEKLPDYDEEGKKIKKMNDAFCMYCTSRFNFKDGGGYGTLTKHLTTKHPDKFGLESTQTQLRGMQVSNSSQTQSSVLHSYSYETHRKELAKFISQKSLPFNFANDRPYEKFTQNVFTPQSKSISRATVTRDIRALVMEFKMKMINEFSILPNKVSICSDVWSDHWQRNFYMGVTCHWVDRSWNLQKRLLAFRDFPLPHSAFCISNLIHVITQEYSITQKIFSISFDNASANTASIDDLKMICRPNIGGLFFHVRCICHILNLCAQDGLRTLENELLPIKGIVNTIHRNKTTQRRWVKFCKENKVLPKVCNNDTPTRWNSTYKLIKSTAQYSDLYCQFNTDERLGFNLFPNNWAVCLYLKKVLKVFDDATKLFSGVYYPTSHLVVENCLKIAYVFMECEKNDDLLECVYSMKKKWLKYFYDIPQAYLVATLLDPNNRDSGLEMYLNEYYQCILPFEDYDFPDVPSIVKNAKESLYRIFQDYTRHVETPRESSGRQASTRGGNSSTRVDADDEIVGFQAFLKQKKTRMGRTGMGTYGPSPTKELDNFFTTPFEYGTLDESGESVEFDILKWWGARHQLYPTVSVIAKEILAIPVSTVSVEQAFSEGGYMLDERRSNLRPHNLEAQMLLHDWANAEDRSQKNVRSSSEESETFYDTTSSTEA